MKLMEMSKFAEFLFPLIKVAWWINREHLQVMQKLCGSEHAKAHMIWYMLPPLLGNLTIEGPGELTIRPSTYHPEFSCAIENMRIQYRWKGQIPMQWVTSIYWDEG